MMIKKMAFIILLATPLMGLSQSRSTAGWIDYGSGHVNKWLQFASQTMGPNALPVPYTDDARVGKKSMLETGAHYHWMAGDTTLNSYLRIYWSVAPGKVAIEVWGCPTETFRMINEVRDRRQVYWDDKGWMTHAGDLWISTYIQILKNKRFLPDVVINYSTKTTTGISEYARYTDAPVHYFYLALGKSLMINRSLIDEIRLSGQAGFYVWQTNKVEVAQDEGPMFGLSLQIKKALFQASTEFSGYWGYDAYQINGPAGQNNNDPLVLRSKIEYGGKIKGKFEYQTGFRNYPYQSLRLSMVYSF